MATHTETIHARTGLSNGFFTIPMSVGCRVRTVGLSAVQISKYKFKSVEIKNTFSNEIHLFQSPYIKYIIHDILHTCRIYLSVVF